MSLSEIRNKYARGAVLELLKDGTKANDDVLHGAVVSTKALQVDRDQVRNAVRWLERQGYVSVEEVGPYLVAQIRQAGRDFLDGHTADDGIQRHLD